MADTTERQSESQLPPVKVNHQSHVMQNGFKLSSLQDTPGRNKLRSYLNKNFRIRMTDGRILIGIFLCTDADANLILGMCSEFRDEEERNLGLVIVPKKHITSIEVDTAGDKYDLV